MLAASLGMKSARCRRLVVVVAIVLAIPQSAGAFSVLAHQAIVDQAWDNSLVPLIQKRFLGVTPQQLSEAHDYARGGSHLPDLGYFPLGSRLFTDLLHYVRTGDFITRLLDEARTPDELAFALGMLGHYEADINGHTQATNLSVPIIYPKLAKRYGESATYADSPSAHLATEFRFDVLQVAHRREIPNLLEHSIDFKVPGDFLKRVFRETYGLDLNDVFKDYDVAINTYRWGFRTLLNEGTGIAWQLYRDDITSESPGTTSKEFVQNISRGDFIREFGAGFRQPSYFLRFVGFVGNLIPNVGPLKRLPFKPLPPDVQRLYFAAYANSYKEYIREVNGIGDNKAVLGNIILDTGQPSQPGLYEPADKAYVELLERHADEHFAQTPQPVLDDLRTHFQEPDRALKFATDQKKRAKAMSAISELESFRMQASR